MKSGHKLFTYSTRETYIHPIHNISSYYTGYIIQVKAIHTREIHIQTIQELRQQIEGR